MSIRDGGGFVGALGRKTALTVHIHGTPDWTPPPRENLTSHPDEAGAPAEFWCVAFDGGPDESQACALVAREGAAGYVGFWSSGDALVADVLTTLETATPGGLNRVDE